jgi:hypothetical protein
MEVDSADISKAACTPALPSGEEGLRNKIMSLDAELAVIKVEIRVRVW